MAATTNIARTVCFTVLVCAGGYFEARAVGHVHIGWVMVLLVGLGVPTPQWVSV
jgi:hypothetical protein